MKVQRIAGALSRVSIWNVNHLQVYFRRIGSSLFFFRKGAWNISNRKYHVSVYFLRRVIPPSFSVQGKNTMLQGKKILSFQIVQKRSCPGTILIEKTIFSEHLMKISYFCVFFLRKIIFHFPFGGKIIFLGNRNIIFPDNTRKIKFQRNFFGKTIFSGRLEKESMVFRRVQHVSLLFLVQSCYKIRS